MLPSTLSVATEMAPADLLLKAAVPSDQIEFGAGEFWTKIWFDENLPQVRGCWNGPPRGARHLAQHAIEYFGISFCADLASFLDEPFELFGVVRFRLRLAWHGN